MVHSDKKLFLVFEYLDRDLKKYMDSVPAGGISLPLVKVIETVLMFKVYYYHMPHNVVNVWVMTTTVFASLSCSNEKVFFCKT